MPPILIRRRKITSLSRSLIDELIFSLRALVCRQIIFGEVADDLAIIFNAFFCRNGIGQSTRIRRLLLLLEPTGQFSNLRLHFVECHQYLPLHTDSNSTADYLYVLMQIKQSPVNRRGFIFSYGASVVP